MHRFLHALHGSFDVVLGLHRKAAVAAWFPLLLAVLATPCWSLERSVGESLTVPVPEGVRLHAKNPHEMIEGHRLSWAAKTTLPGRSEGSIYQFTKTTDVTQMRQALEDIMTRIKDHNVRLKIAEGTYSPVEVAPLKRGPWKEAYWCTYKEHSLVPSSDGKSDPATRPPLYLMKMLLWDGEKMWISGFGSRDETHLAKWLEILESVELNAKTAKGGKEK